tara:strand:+ start:1633 stop:1896 length:264 start_codon:yes stop_codon:yes gene_type:complete
MKNELERQELPKWFNGRVYDSGDFVTNRFTGQSIELTAIELSMYDLVMGITLMMEMGLGTDRMARDHKKVLSWFMKRNAEAYKVLLD